MIYFKMELIVTHDTCLGTVRKSIAGRLGKDPKHLIFGEIFSKRIYSIYSDDNMLADMRNDEVVL